MVRTFAGLFLALLLAAPGCDPGQDSGDETRTASAFNADSAYMAVRVAAVAKPFPEFEWLPPVPYIKLTVNACARSAETMRFVPYTLGESLILSDTVADLVDPAGLTAELMDDNPMFPDRVMGVCSFTLTEDDLNAGVMVLGLDKCDGQIESMAFKFERVTNPDQMVAAGAKTFEDHCAMCHGADGHKTNPAMGTRDLGSDGVQSQTDGQLYTDIVNGRGKMPSFVERLDGGAVHELVAFIRSIKN